MKIALGRSSPAYFKNVHGLCTVLYSEGLTLGRRNTVSAGLSRGVAHQDLATAGVGLQTGRNVNRVTNCGIFGASVGADVADRRHPCMKSDPHRNFRQSFGPESGVYLGKLFLHHNRSFDRI